MTRYSADHLYQEHLEYHGSTAIERILKRAGATIKREWLYFDSVREAESFFNDYTSEYEGYRLQRAS